MKKQDRNSAVKKASSARAHQVRIIGGTWKRTPLTVPDAEGLRPTPDRVRETVFNWLGHLLDANWAPVSCLDFFAGSGALGFEAASRGARSVTLVENFGPAIRLLEATRQKLQADSVNIIRGDALAIAQDMVTRKTSMGSMAAVELIFLDPPYHHDWLPRMLPLCAQLLAPDGLVYVEAEQSLAGENLPDWMTPWEVVRADKAGLVFYHLMRRKNSA